MFFYNRMSDEIIQRLEIEIDLPTIFENDVNASAITVDKSAAKYLNK